MDSCFTSSHQLAAAKSNPSTVSHLTVVMPIAVHQLLYLHINLWSWELFAPCAMETSTELSSRVNLLFYSNVPLMEPDKNQILEWLRQAGHARKCFGTVEFRSAHLPAAVDRYGYGTLLMWRYLWGPNRANILDPEKTNIIFYMEADTRPIRDRWLESLFQVFLINLQN